MRIALAALLVLLTLPLAAAEPRRAVYFEQFGNAGLYSVNYEREVRPQWMARAGAGAWSAEDIFSDNKVQIVSVPLTLSYITGTGNHHFESGFGVTVGHKHDDVSGSGAFSSLTGILGYRYQKPEGGFLFRVGATPFLSLTGGDHAYPDEGATALIGLSFGYAF